MGHTRRGHRTNEDDATIAQCRSRRTLCAACASTSNSPVSLRADVPDTQREAAVSGELVACIELLVNESERVSGRSIRTDCVTSPRRTGSLRALSHRG